MRIRSRRYRPKAKPSLGGEAYLLPKDSLRKNPEIVSLEGFLTQAIDAKFSLMGEESKYQRWYDQIVIHAADDRNLGVYSERHHILPRSLGGGDEPSNLVRLTYREHFLVHWLLAKIYDGDARRVMVYALHCMTFGVAGRVVSGWQFEVAKRAVKSEVQKRAVARKEVWLAQKRLERENAMQAVESSKESAPRLDPIKNRYRLGGMADNWLDSYGSIKRSEKKPSAPKVDPVIGKIGPRKRGFPSESRRLGVACPIASKEK